MWFNLTKIGISLIMTGSCILPNIDYFTRYKKYWNGQKTLIYKTIETTGAVLMISSLYFCLLYTSPSPRDS